MGLVLVLIYIALNLLSPADMLPVLAPYRPMLILAFLNVPFALLGFLEAPEIRKLHVQPLLVLFFFGTASVALIPHRLYGANLETFLELVPNVIAYFFGIIAFRSPQRLRLVRLTLVLVAFFVLYNALLQLPYAHASGLELPYVLAHGPSLSAMVFRIRGLGVLHDPNTYGQFLLLIIPLLFVAKNDTGLGIGWFGAVGTTLLFIWALYLTGSRGSFLGLAVILGLFLIRRLKFTGALITMMLGGGLLLAVNAYTSRAISMAGGMDRLAIWSDGMSYFKQSPLWGIGPRNFVSNLGVTAHNSYLLVAVELGIIGYFFWMSMIVVSLVQLSRIVKMEKAAPVLRRWAFGLRISLGGYLFTSFFLSRAYDLPLYMLLGMSGGLVIAAGGDEAVPLRGSWWAFWSILTCIGLLVLIYLMLRLRAV